MNSAQFLFLICAVAIHSTNQFTITTEQWKPIDVNQYYNQILEQYLLSYYNYLNQQNFVLNHQKINDLKNVSNVSPIFSSITNTTTPMDELKIEDRSTNGEQKTVRPSLLRKNKIILSRRPTVKPTRSKLKPIFYKANSMD